MIAYPLHHTRIVHSLNGVWDFAFLGDTVDLVNLDAGSVAFGDRMAVPGAFDASPAYAGKRGTAVYRTRVHTHTGVPGLLHFEGLGLWCRVLVDGQVLYEGSLPYSGFSVDVPPSDLAERELVVVIDNRWDGERVPLQEPFFDFYGYGGFYRGVQWHELPACSIDRVQVRTTDLGSGRVHARVLLRGDTPAKIDLWTAFDDGPEQLHAACAVRNGEVALDLTVPAPIPWSPDDPALHTLRVRTEDDDMVERFGLRTIETRGGKILLNGREIRLLGYCRHEAHPQFGPALPLQQLVQDIQILKDLGCNFVRGAHYPQDQRFLDLCDERGLMVMEESLAWGQGLDHFRNPRFCDAQEAQTRQMVRNSVNHPCVILWGFMNEGHTQLKESRKLYKRLFDCVRDEDTSRLVSYASNHPFDDVNFDLCDVICVNTYPAWYAEDKDSAAPLHEIRPRVKGILAHVDASGHIAKPFLFTEIGAGAIYGWHDPLHTHWSEEYQAAYLEIACHEILSNPRISGVSLWQFCDSRTVVGARALSRPRAFNNKGIVDEYRRPKLAYTVVKHAFRGDQVSRPSCDPANPPQGELTDE